MKTKFLKDDRNEIWFFYAEDIKIRQKTGKEEITTSSLNNAGKNTKDSLIRNAKIHA